VSGYPLPCCPALAVRNLAASALWYEAGLGFRLVFSNVGAIPGVGDPEGEDGAPRLAHLRWAESADLVLTADDPQIALAGARGLGVTLRFQVAGSVDALAARVQSYGIEILLGPVDRPWKAREFVVADPDGYHVAFSGRMQGELPLEMAAEAEIVELVEAKAVVTAG
jgi:catechol 2,3-dioxygenase-like lactoylglutathione lyase family enzyme